MADPLTFAIGTAFAVVLVTLAFMATAGRRIMRTSRGKAAVAGALFAPALILAAAFTYLCSPSDAPPPNDAGAMAFGALFVIGLCAFPVSLATTALYMVRHRSWADRPPR